MADLLPVGLGTPSMVEMTSTGNGPEKSATRSNSSRSMSGSRCDRTTDRIIGSNASTARGVNTRLTSLRSCSCSGGSSMMMLVPRTGLWGSLSWSMVTPCSLLNVFQSRWADTTSS